MSISDQTKDKIKQSISISEIARTYPNIVLEPSGADKFKTCCPFHKEKTPSCIINDREGFFHCFGCGENGDVITLVSKIEGISFIEAIKQVAKHAGINIDQELSKSRVSMAELQEHEKLYQLMEESAKFYHEALFNNQGKAFLEYFTNQRKLSIQTLYIFKCGFAEGGSALYSHLKKLGFDDKVIVQSGMVKKIGNSMLDFFYNRGVIPITNIDNRVIGFGGRILPLIDSTAPKYINTPESPIFKKRDNIFNMARAMAAIKQSARIDCKNQLILVEGYMDVISCSQAGFSNVIAPLGTSITELQIKSILSKSRQPIVCLNSDDAGQKATLRCAEKILPELKIGYIPKFATINTTGHKDLDDIILHASDSIDAENKLTKIFNSAQEIQDFLWSSNIVGANFANPNQVANILHKLNTFCATIKEPTIKDAYTKFFKNKVSNAVFLASKSSKVYKTNSSSGTKLPNIVTTSSTDVKYLNKRRYYEIATLYCCSVFVSINKENTNWEELCSLLPPNLSEDIEEAIMLLQDTPSIDDLSCPNPRFLIQNKNIFAELQTFYAPNHVFTKIQESIMYCTLNLSIIDLDSQIEQLKQQKNLDAIKIAVKERALVTKQLQLLMDGDD